jgi:hypothetical protein
MGGWNWKNKLKIVIKQIFKDKKEKRSCLRCAVVDHNVLGSCVTLKKIVLYLFLFILNPYFSLNTFSKTIKTKKYSKKFIFDAKFIGDHFIIFYPFTCHIHMLKLTKKKWCDQMNYYVLEMMFNIIFDDYRFLVFIIN